MLRFFLAHLRLEGLSGFCLIVFVRDFFLDRTFGMALVFVGDLCLVVVFCLFNCLLLLLSLFGLGCESNGQGFCCCFGLF